MNQWPCRTPEDPLCAVDQTAVTVPAGVLVAACWRMAPPLQPQAAASMRRNLSKLLTILLDSPGVPLQQHEVLQRLQQLAPPLMAALSSEATYAKEQRLWIWSMVAPAVSDLARQRLSDPATVDYHLRFVQWLLLQPLDLVVCSDGVGLPLKPADMQRQAGGGSVDEDFERIVKNLVR